MALLAKVARILVSSSRVRHIDGNTGLLAISSFTRISDEERENLTGSYNEEVVTFHQCHKNGWVVHPIFPKARLVFMDRCDPNFVFYNLSPYRFPRAEAIIISGDTGCEAITKFLFSSDQGVIYIPRPVYLHYLDRWYDKKDRTIQPVRDTELRLVRRLLNLVGDQ